MGITEKNLKILEYPIRYLLKYRQKILEEMVKSRKEGYNLMKILGLGMVNFGVYYHLILVPLGITRAANTGIICW